MIAKSWLAARWTAFVIGPLVALVVLVVGVLLPT